MSTKPYTREDLIRDFKTITVEAQLTPEYNPATEEMELSSDVPAFAQKPKQTHRYSIVVHVETDDTMTKEDLSRYVNEMEKTLSLKVKEYNIKEEEVKK